MNNTVCQLSLLVSYTNTKTQSYLEAYVCIGVLSCCHIVLGKYLTSLQFMIGGHLFLK